MIENDYKMMWTIAQEKIKVVAPQLSTLDKDELLTDILDNLYMEIQNGKVIDDMEGYLFVSVKHRYIDRVRRYKKVEQLEYLSDVGYEIEDHRPTNTLEDVTNTLLNIVDEEIRESGLLPVQKEKVRSLCRDVIELRLNWQRKIYLLRNSKPAQKVYENIFKKIEKLLKSM